MYVCIWQGREKRLSPVHGLHSERTEQPFSRGLQDKQTNSMELSLSLYM